MGFCFFTYGKLLNKLSFLFARISLNLNQCRSPLIYNEGNQSHNLTFIVWTAMMKAKFSFSTALFLPLLCLLNQATWNFVPLRNCLFFRLINASGTWLHVIIIKQILWHLFYGNYQSSEVSYRLGKYKKHCQSLFVCFSSGKCKHSIFSRGSLSSCCGNSEQTPGDKNWRPTQPRRFVRHWPHLQGPGLGSVIYHLERHVICNVSFICPVL